jgi:DNA-binding transcriptional MerR regulator
MEGQGHEDAIYISELAAFLDRRIATIRMWDRTGLLPPDLKPFRDERNNRYWIKEQLPGLREWTSSRSVAAGLDRHIPEDVDEHLAKIRTAKAKSPILELHLRIDSIEERVEELEGRMAS